MTGYEAILGAALLALQSPSAVATRVRRAHKTVVPPEIGDTVHLIDGDDAPVANTKCGDRVANFSTSLFWRSDGGPVEIDTLKIAVNDRLCAAAWPENVVVTPGRITIDDEIADTDVTRVDMEWSAAYRTGSSKKLELSA